MNAHVFQGTGTQERPAWAFHIASELEMVDRRLEDVAESDVSIALELSMHLFSAGGKRIRPALVILSALSSGNDGDVLPVVDLAAAAELIHTASLVHDDVVDETHQRRGAPTATGEWGNKISVLGGDFLLAKAFHLLSEIGNVDVTRALASTAVVMAESEIVQAAGEGDLASWEQNYWDIIRDKTAAFMATCCECGCLLAKSDVAVREALVGYGLNLGTAFQITDDVLDITGNPALTGKDSCTDLRHGKFTLPVLLALKAADDGRKQDLLKLLSVGFLGAGEAAEVASMVVAAGGVDKARVAARRYAESACDHLAVLPASQYTESLENLAFSIISRES